MVEKISLREKLALFENHWSPKIIGDVNDFHVKLVKIKGEFVWHKHDKEDEMFLAVKGAFTMQFRDGNVEVSEGECVIVPHGVEHCPVAENEAHILLFEPASTVNTGNAGGDRTVAEPERI